MEELVELLIRAIASLLSNRPAPQSRPPARPGGTPPRPPANNAGRAAPPSMIPADRPAALTPRPPAAARRVAPPPIGGSRRRVISPPPVMIAEPIVTGTASAFDTVPAPAAFKPTNKPVTAVKPSPRAGVIRGWLSPGSLKKQYILTELLQPPVAMRERQ